MNPVEQALPPPWRLDAAVGIAILGLQALFWIALAAALYAVAPPRR
jgi:hypothetical protein